jgi:hypothetical protein
MGAHDHFFGVVKRPRLAEDFVGDSHFADVVKKSGASQHGEIREGNGNVLGNGNGVGGDALGMAGGFRFFKVQSARALVSSAVFFSSSSTMMYLASIIIWRASIPLAATKWLLAFGNHMIMLSCQ